MPQAAAPLRASGNDAAPVLMGETSPRRILKITPEWRSRYDAYTPQRGTIDNLRAAAKALKPDLQVDVVFGSWCGDSRDQVPKFLRVQRELGRGLLPSAYFAVARDKKSPAAAVEGRNIEKVPTFIVTFRGLEIGRIIESPEASIEADLLEILSRPR